MLRAVGIRWRLVALIVVILVPVILLLVANARDERDRLTESVNQDILNQAKIVASAHDQLLETVERLLVALAQDPVIRNFTEPACNVATARVTAAHPAYSNVAVSNLDGVVVCSAIPEGIGSPVWDRPYYQEALKQENLSTSGYLFGRISLRPVDVFTMPVFDDSGALSGVLELSVDLAWLVRLIESQELHSAVQTTLLGPDGLVLVRVPADDVTTGSNIGEQEWARAASSSRVARTLMVEEPGRPGALGAVVPLAPLSGVVPGYVVVTALESTALAGAETAFERGLVTVVLIGLVSVSWVWGVTTLNVHRPVSSLLEAARSYGRGQFSQRVEVSRTTSHELTELAEAFNSMSDAMATSQDALRRAASTDLLTGYPNRVELARLIDQELAQSPEQAAALVKIRLRNFSGVNATFGYDGGDALLQQVPARLAQSMGALAMGARATGASGAPESTVLVGRTDGDEFVALAPTSGDDVVAQIGEALTAMFDAPFALDGEPVYLSARASMAHYPADGVTATELARRTSLAIARARGDQVVAYSSAADEPRAGQVVLLGELHQALEAGELELFYQPKVSLADWRVTGVEALVRWRRADGRLMGPGEFIPLAEQSGYIRVVTEWVLRDAARQLSEWRDAGLDLHVAVNVSAPDFEDERLPDRLRALREEFGLADGAMDIEITESALLFDADEAAGLSVAIRESGFTIGIDDFGTGHSGLVYLQRLPVTTLKIDRSFVSAIMDDRRSREVVAGTIDLARRFGLTIVAEGIESEEIAQALRWMGCDVGQGYYFSRPMPAHEVPAWVLEFGARHAEDPEDSVVDVVDFGPIPGTAPAEPGEEVAPA